MGTKFANIHIRGVDTHQVEFILKEYLEKHDKRSFKKEADIFNKQNDSLSGIFDLFLDSFCYYAGQVHKDWVTVLNSSFGWESIEETGQDLSKYFEGIILAVGYFDDDVFSLHLIKKGKTLTSHISGAGAECYGVNENLGDINLIITELSLEISNEKLDFILKMEDLYKKVEELEKVIGLPLLIEADWLDNLPDHLKEKFISIK